MELTYKTIANLLDKNADDDVKVSIYIPTHVKSTVDNVKADQTRFKNAIASVRSQLPKHESKLHKIYEQLETLLQSEEFWRHQNLSLAVFATHKQIETVSLPIEVSELCEISDNFVINPLLFSLRLQASCLVVDVNLDAPRIYKASINTISDIEHEKFVSLKDMMENDHQHNQQFHTPTGNRQGSPMFHGHGGSGDHAFEEIKLYLQYLASNLQAIVKKHQLPILLAGEKNRITQLEPMLSGIEVMPQKLLGSQQSKNKDQLHESIREILINRVEHDIKSSIQTLKQSRRKAKGWDETIAAIKSKAVKTLFIPGLRKTKDSVRSGYTQEYVLEHLDQTDNFEAIAQATIEQGGEVEIVDNDSLLGGQPQAVLRF